MEMRSDFARVRQSSETHERREEVKAKNNKQTHASNEGSEVERGRHKRVDEEAGKQASKKKKKGRRWSKTAGEAYAVKLFLTCN